MKKIAAFALLASAAVAASAQSSITLFGVVDAGISQVKNGDTKTNAVSSGGLSPSRFGLRGSEDLGDGLKAQFWLEHGFNVDNATPADSTRFFNRRSTIALAGSLGELRLGRDLVPSYTGYGDFDAFGDVGVGQVSKFVSKLGSNTQVTNRSDNVVSYFLPPNLGGVYGQLSVAPSEGTVGKKYTAGRVGYTTGPLNVSLAYGVTTVTPISGEDKYSLADVGASYDFGVVKLTGAWLRTKLGADKYTAYNVGALVPVTSLATLRVSYTKGDRANSPDDANQFALGGLYTLSKRTTLYGTVSVLSNKGASALSVSDGYGSATGVAGRRSTGVEMGIRHVF